MQCGIILGKDGILDQDLVGKKVRKNRKSGGYDRRKCFSKRFVRDFEILVGLLGVHLEQQS